jgi:hypothetical protein
MFVEENSFRLDVKALFYEYEKFNEQRNSITYQNFLAHFHTLQSQLNQQQQEINYLKKKFKMLQITTKKIDKVPDMKIFCDSFFMIFFYLVFPKLTLQFTVKRASNRLSKFCLLWEDEKKGSDVTLKKSSNITNQVRQISEDLKIDIEWILYNLVFSSRARTTRYFMTVHDQELTLKQTIQRFQRTFSTKEASNSFASTSTPEIYLEKTFIDRITDENLLEKIKEKKDFLRDYVNVITEKLSKVKLIDII